MFTFVAGGTTPQNTELQRKLQENIKKGKEALSKTRNKVNSILLFPLLLGACCDTRLVLYLELPSRYIRYCK